MNSPNKYEEWILLLKGYLKESGHTYSDDELKNPLINHLYIKGVSVEEVHMHFSDKLFKRILPEKLQELVDNHKGFDEFYPQFNEFCAQYGVEAVSTFIISVFNLIDSDRPFAAIFEELKICPTRFWTSAIMIF